MTAPVVTGLGIVAPNGLGTEAYWAATKSGKSGIGTVTRFDPAAYPVRLAGQVPGFVPAEHVPSRLLPQTDHATRLSLSAAADALADSGLTAAEAPEFGIGVVTASSMGGFEFGQRELQNLWAKGGEHVSAYQSFAWFYAVNTGQISIRHGLRGPGLTVVADQAGGLDAIGAARRQLRKATPHVLTGGVDGALCPLGLVGQLSTGELSTQPDPEQAYLPFDERANGYLPGEGGALMMLEHRETALARGAHIHGEILGYAATFDPDPAHPAPDGLYRAARDSVRDAGLEPAEIDAVFADAAGDPVADRQEAAAIARLFGPGAVPVAVPKTMTGRLCAGAGPLDVAAALLSLAEGILPPAINIDRPADHPIDLVVGAPRRPARLRTALVLARGRGGFNSAVVVRGEPDHRGTKSTRDRNATKKDLETEKE